MENHHLLLAAQNVVTAYMLVQSAACNERGYRNAVIAAEQMRDLLTEHLRKLEQNAKRFRETGWPELALK